MRVSEIDKSSVGLLVSNLVPLVGVLVLGWNAHGVLITYWLESAVIGLFFWRRILRAEGDDDADELPNLRLNRVPITDFIGKSNERVGRFFLYHYGGFWVGHGLFVGLLGFGMPSMSVPRLLIAVTLGTASLAAYHYDSYRRNFIAKAEYEHSGPVTLMIEPYRRVLVMHVTIIAVGWTIATAGVVGVVVMVLLKTLLDFYGHWKEHDRARRRAEPKTATYKGAP